MKDLPTYLLCVCIHTVALLSADTVVAIKMGDGLDQIGDMGEICKIMKSLQIPTKGLKNFEEMKAKLRDFLKHSATKRVSEVSALFFLIHLHNYMVNKFYDSQQTVLNISSFQYYC